MSKIISRYASPRRLSSDKRRIGRLIGGIVCVLILILGGVLATGSLDWPIQEFISREDAKDSGLTAGQGNTSAYFSDDYFEARARFISAANRAGAQMSQIPIRAQGPAGEPLIIDIAWLGDRSPERAMIHASGIHGVEGFAGSAIQLRLLENPPEVPEGAAVIFVHALNPYGMAWLRRYNETNVDLNRNFRFSEQEWAASPAFYERLDSVLNPPDHKLFDSFLLPALYLKLRYGNEKLRQTIPTGQNFNPSGLFYCGTQLEEGPRRYRRWLQEHLGAVNYLLVIDVHTGLGRRGQESLFHKIRSTGTSHLEQKLSRMLPLDYESEKGVSYEIGGPHANLYEHYSPVLETDFVTQEFGTYPNLYVVQALRDENRFHHLGGRSIDDTTKLRLKEAFYPQDNAWKAKVLEDGVSLFEKAAGVVFENSE